MLSDGLTAEDKQALASATPVERQENELLRSIVLKQLRRQAQMKQAKELLLTQLDRVGARSDTLLGLVEDMARGSQLSEEEKALFKAPQFEEIIAAAGATEAPAVPEGAGVASAEGANPAVMSATLIAPGNGPSPAGVSPDGVIEKQKLTVELAQIDHHHRQAHAGDGLAGALGEVLRVVGLSAVEDVDRLHFPPRLWRPSGPSAGSPRAEGPGVGVRAWVAT